MSQNGLRLIVKPFSVKTAAADETRQSQAFAALTEFAERLKDFQVINTGVSYVWGGMYFGYLERLGKIYFAITGQDYCRACSEICAYLQNFDLAQPRVQLGLIMVLHLMEEKNHESATCAL